MKYRLLGKSGLRVSEASLGTMTFGDEWGWGSPKAEALKVYETYARQVETLLTRRISTPTALVRHSLESSCRPSRERRSSHEVLQRRARQ